MRRNKKGFTLIELLAVIVILAVIALIATPSILSMIDKSRRGAAEESMRAYAATIEKELLINDLGAGQLQNGTFSIVDAKHIALRSKDASGTVLDAANSVRIEIKGSGPVKVDGNYDTQYVYVDGEGNVRQAEMKFSSYYIYYYYNSDVSGDEADTVICSSTKSFSDARGQSACSGKSVTNEDQVIIKKTTTGA